MIKLRRICKAENVTHLREKRITYEFLIGKPEETKPEDQVVGGRRILDRILLKLD
jgi:hypothetical protein